MEFKMLDEYTIQYTNGISVSQQTIDIPIEMIPEENRKDSGLEWPTFDKTHHKESLEKAKKSWQATGKVYHLLGMDENCTYTKIKEYPEYSKGKEKFIAIPGSTYARDINKFYHLPPNRALDENTEEYYTRKIEPLQTNGEITDGRLKFVEHSYENISEIIKDTDVIEQRYGPSVGQISFELMGHYLKDIFLVEAVPGQRYEKGQERAILKEELQTENKELRGENSRLQEENEQQKRQIEELQRSLQEKEEENSILTKKVRVFSEFIKKRVLKTNLFTIGKLKKSARDLES